MRRLVISKSITNRESESLEKYLREVGKIPVLSPEEETKIFSLIRGGDKKAMDTVIKANLRFVVSVAKQYQGQGLPLSDLINEGNLGLMKATSHFDETKGFKFISFAVWWIRQFILAALKQQGRMVRMPSNKVLLTNQIQRVSALLEQRFERPATADEIAEEMNMEAKDIRQVLASNANHVSLDAKISEEDETSLADTIENPNAEKTDKKVIHTESLSEDLKQSFRSLTKMQEQTICLLYGIGSDNPMSVDQISEKFSLSRERIRQIKDKAISKLRTMKNIHLLQRYLTA